MGGDALNNQHSLVTSNRHNKGLHIGKKLQIRKQIKINGIWYNFSLLSIENVSQKAILRPNPHGRTLA